MFILKKVISAFLLPMPLFLGVITLGLCLLWFTRRQRAGKILCSAGVVALALSSYDAVSNLFLTPLENDFPALLVPGHPCARDAQARQARWIVVLGGGHNTAPTLPPTSELNVVTLARVVEAVRLKHQVPSARLVVSGGYGAGITQADVARAAAVSLGVAPADVVREGRTYDTADEARFIHEIVRDEPFILVTSASHLPRAVALFRKQGMSPLPAPADYGALDDPGISPYSFIPSPASVSKLERASHEYLGLLWGRLRGQL
jgi:uncharacterized SAM-binding protein YcdF (DUF218 family)